MHLSRTVSLSAEGPRSSFPRSIHTIICRTGDGRYGQKGFFPGMSESGNFVFLGIASASRGQMNVSVGYLIGE